MRIYISFIVAIMGIISCDNDEDSLTSDNTFSLDDVKYETPYCFFEDWGIEAGNRDFRRYDIQFVSNDQDGDPFVLDNPNTHVATFVLFSPSLTELQSGEYTLSTATNNTLCTKEWKPGEYLGISVGLKLKESTTEIIETWSGKITVKKLGDNQYYFSYSGACDNGMSLKGSFKGSVTILDYKKWGCWEN